MSPQEQLYCPQSIYAQLGRLLDALVPEPVALIECQQDRNDSFWQFLVECGDSTQFEQVLAELEVRARQTFQVGLDGLDLAGIRTVLRSLMVAHMRMNAWLSQKILIWFYGRKAILGLLKQQDSAPFPYGNAVEAGDLGLLEPVILRGPCFRSIAPTMREV